MKICFACGKMFDACDSESQKQMCPNCIRHMNEWYEQVYPNLIEEENMETKTSNTIADLNVCLAADDIIEIFEQQGFTSDTPPDIEQLRHLIVTAIQNRTEGTTTHASFT